MYVELLYYKYRPRSIVLQLIVLFSLMTRLTRKIVRCSRTAYGARHDISSHAWRSVISRDASPPRIYSHAAGDALEYRARGLPGRAERRACKANLSHGVPLAARYTADIVNRSGKWSKRLPEPCQRNRITSTGRPRLSESPPQWRRGFNATLLEISSIDAIEPPSQGFTLISM